MVATHAKWHSTSRWFPPVAFSITQIFKLVAIILINYKVIGLAMLTKSSDMLNKTPGV